jgi:hypothetical protein
MQRKEIWRPHPAIPKLMISNRGAVQFRDRHHKPRPHKTWDYHQIRINGKGYQVHRLVAETFIGPIPPLYVVNHKDGNKSNNSTENLEIVTQMENMRHARRTGLIQYRPGRSARFIIEFMKLHPPTNPPKSNRLPPRD